MPTEPMYQGDLMPFLRAHDCFRRDLARVEALLTADEPLTGARAEALAAYWDGVVELLEHHHRTEDDNMLPALVERMPSAARIVDDLEREHVELQHLLDETTPLVTALAGPQADRPAAAERVTRLRRLVETHLDREEETFVPLFSQAFTRAEWFDIEARTTAALTRDGLLPFALPWAAEGLDPAVMDLALQTLPGETREAYHRDWLARHLARVRLIWGAADPAPAAETPA
ncbi:hemerythrin domain-containing protein [Micromonospora sp. NPDC049101]|uniref:hemerythrin domain-containing protein n=1 Tax=Micromonospora sp. NPDC049101 TaxID=3155032 RepID=UPI003404177B